MRVMGRMEGTEAKVLEMEAEISCGAGLIASCPFASLLSSRPFVGFTTLLWRSDGICISVTDTSHCTGSMLKNPGVMIYIGNSFLC